MSTLESLLSNNRSGLGTTALTTLATQMQDKLVRKLDADGDGRVDQGEFKAALDKLAGKLGVPVTDDPEALFAQVDADGDGSLNGSEISQMLVSALQSTGSSSAATTGKFGVAPTEASSPEIGLFARMDGNGDGHLTQEEFMTGMMQARVGAQVQGPMMHRVATFSTFSTFDMGGFGGMPQWMPMGWAPVPAGFAMAPTQFAGGRPTGHVTAPQAAPASAASATASAPAATQTIQPADALNALLAAADSDQDGRISSSELSALVAQLGSQLQAAAQLTGRMGPVGDDTSVEQA